MELKILIKTPDGYAQSTEKRLRPFLIVNKGKLHKIMTNKKDNKILWIVDAKPRQYKKIIRNVSTYKIMVTSILKNKTVQKVAKLSEQDKKDLDSMLDDNTEIDVVLNKDYDNIKKEFHDI